MQTRDAKASTQKSYAGATAILFKRLYEGKAGKWESWLWTTEHALRQSCLDRSHWGEALIQGLGDDPREAVRMQLGQPSADLLSYDDMVQVLTNMYGAKETVSSIQTKMEHLHLKDENSMASFLQLRTASPP